VAAFVAVLFLSTATLHVMAHSGLFERSCAVCHVSQSRVVAAASPRIVVTAAVGSLLAETTAPRAVTARGSSDAARAPPAFSV